ncbi:MAG: serine/threonine protein kinase, partial [bacterium]
MGFDLVLRRQVAIKVPLDKWLADPQARDQYLVEARAVARLPTHPHLVPVYDVGRLPSGAVYVVSEYVAGTTLEAELKQGLPTLERAVAILQALANALL